MLKLHHHKFLSSLSQSSHRPRLSATRHEDDELIAAIEREHDGEVFTLDKTPDVVGLEEFWTGVEADLQKDPSWYSFSNN
jgi:hypothetical protein